MGIFFIGLLAGILDGAAASLLAWTLAKRPPAAVFRFVASGLYGPRAFNGRYMVPTGVALHMVIALAFTAAYFGLCTLWSWPLQHPAGAAVSYGTVVWVIMNLVVIPLSKTPPRPMPLWLKVINLVILIVAIGAPVAWGARWYFKAYL
ncbi:hypothetical protein [Dinghuibacter silviterrae]|uniref:DUF1440 domain-containing protein n=1 Tax=Dinghuibacter silviterrae TaxID=1539049 RepID=A0A4R8DR76_9BACT|nr:hypothetical protein [Dinghuibacter silviterrae]TDX00326.1 hypothetical protein EDB95_1347 [Dinghuibacter silviterrae]